MSEHHDPSDGAPGDGAGWAPSWPFGGSSSSANVPHAGDPAGWTYREPYGAAPPQPPLPGEDPGFAYYGSAAPALDQQPWQDHTGQWHYPYAAQHAAQQPASSDELRQQQDSIQAWEQQQAVAAGGIGGLVDHQRSHQQQMPRRSAVPPMQPVHVTTSEPLHAAPSAPVRDPQRTALAGVIAFISLVVALWAILGFVHSMAETLSSVSAGNDKLAVQLTEANEGLTSLATKTGSVNVMVDDTKTLRTQLETIDKNMGDMLSGVDAIGGEMGAMSNSLTTLDNELGNVNGINKTMANDLGKINSGLALQRQQVVAMRKDVQGTGGALKTLGPRLGAVNSRLTHINGVVCFMGEKGVLNNLKVHIKVPLLGEIGTAEVSATVVPAGSWRC